MLMGIESANEKALSQIILSAIRRAGALYPDDDIIVLSLPKEPAARQETLELFLLKLRDGSLQ